MSVYSPKNQDDLTAWKQHAVSHPDSLVDIPNNEVAKFTDVQETALDLYNRELNVFPLPTAYEWREKRSGKKAPFIARPLYYNRLHHCDITCKHKGRIDFTYLFDHTNIGLMMGRTSGNLFALDCDSQEAFENIGGVLDRKALPYWAITSHRGGSYILRLKEGEAANVELPNHVEVWGNRHYIVIPPSIHPQGTVYQWVTPEPRFHIQPGKTIPAVSIKDIEFLGVSLDQAGKWQKPDLFGLPEWAGVLSYENRKTYAGVIEGERNHRLTSLAYDLKAHHVDFGEAETVTLKAAENCTPAYPQKDTKAIVKSAYQKERTPATDRKIKTWQLAKTFAQSYNWKLTFGRRSNTRKAVYMACVERARRDNASVFRASIRETAVIANKSVTTVMDALADLCIAELLKRIGSNADTKASLYKFILPKDYSQLNTISSPCSNSVLSLEYPKTQAEMDVFGKLGFVTYQVWRYLCNTPTKNAYRTAKAMGKPASSVYQAFKRLRKNGLVTFGHAEGLYFGEAKTDASLQYLAADMGVDGKTKQKIRNFEIERERYINLQMARAIRVFRCL